MWTYTLVTATFPLMYQSNAARIEHGYCWLKFPIGYQIFQVTANFLIPIVFIIAVYVKLFMISCAHANKTARTINAIGAILLNPMDVADGNSKPHKCTKPKKLTCCAMLYRNLKASKRIALLVGVFLFCWLPFIILLAVNYVCLCIPREITWLANVINYSSVAINPLLYGFLNKQIRKEVSKKIRRAKQNFQAAHTFTLSRRQTGRKRNMSRQDSTQESVNGSNKSRKITETEFLNET